MLSFASPSYAGGEALDRLRDEAISYFKPMVGNVIALANDDIVLTDVPEASGIKKGMRLEVKEAGGVFLHPITKEPVGAIEKVVGVAEAEEVGSGGSMLRLIRGGAFRETVKTGDIVRLHSSKVAAFFYPSKSVDWFVAEEYVRRLKESGRFELHESGPLSGGEGEAVAEAERAGAEFAFLLSSDGGTLRQRLVWVEGMKEFSYSEAVLEGGFVEGLRLGEKFFRPGEKGLK